MNRIDKPKLTSKALVEKLRDEKGVTFKYISEEKAAKYLANVNNYLRTAAYRKNYQKHQKGVAKGKYIDLDFSYLQELSTIDMHLRNLVTKMCIDIEHDLKVLLLKNLEMDSAEDGYTIVDNFLSLNPMIVEKIAEASASPFTGNLIHKYFTIQTVYNPQKRRMENTIVAFDCPVWVLMELMSFGGFIRFYKYYYGIKGNMPNINQNQRQKKLSCRAILEFVCMLCVYEQVVSEKVKKHRVEELKQFFEIRINQKKGFFIKNQLITSTFNFLEKVVNNIFV